MDLSNNLDSLEELLSYKFSKRELLKLSLTHRSFSQENNEIYEFLGDSIINLCTSIWLMNKNKDLTTFELDFYQQEGYLVRESMFNEVELLKINSAFEARTLAITALCR